MVGQTAFANKLLSDGHILPICFHLCHILALSLLVNTVKDARSRMLLFCYFKGMVDVLVILMKHSTYSCEDPVHIIAAHIAWTLHSAEVHKQQF